MTEPHNRSGGSRVLRWLLVAFVLASCVRVWLGPGEVIPRAQAQIPDSGLQRKKQLDATIETNAILRQIHSTLQRETLSVRVVEGGQGGGKGVVPNRKTRQ